MSSEDKREIVSGATCGKCRQPVVSYTVTLADDHRPTFSTSNPCGCVGAPLRFPVPPSEEDA